MEMEVGTKWKFAEIKDEGDELVELTVVEDRGERVLVVDNVTAHMFPRPTASYFKSELVPA